MQAYEWGEFKRATGWKVQRLGLVEQGQLVAGAQLLFKPLPFTPWSLAYLSKGPVVAVQQTAVAQQLWGLIHQAARQQNAIYLMLEPNWPDDEATQNHLKQQDFITSPHTNHPHSTVLIDLTRDEATMLSQMRKKTRQMVRKAEREGIVITEGNEADLAEFHDVLLTTAELKEIASHDLSFYQTAWWAYNQIDLQGLQNLAGLNMAGQISQTKLFFAKHAGKTVAAKLIFTFGKRSLHLWGGTTKAGRDLNASYLIQWESLKWAKRQGCTMTDLWGIPDEVGRLLKQGEAVPEEKHDGLWGVYLFKRGFGGEVESYVGTWDYVYMPWLYQAAQMARGFSVDRLSELAEKLKFHTKIRS